MLTLFGPPPESSPGRLGRLLQAPDVFDLLPDLLLELLFDLFVASVEALFSSF